MLSLMMIVGMIMHFEFRGKKILRLGVTFVVGKVDRSTTNVVRSE